MLSMQSFTVSKDVQIVDVIGLIQTELAPNTALQNGDDLASGTVLSLSPGSKITLRFDDGSEQLIIGKPDETLANNTQTTQQALESLIAQTQDQTATAATPDGVKDNINVLQASIESGDDIELPDTISGELAANEGTNFIKLDRDGKELLAVAGFDTTELDNAIELADETNIDAVNLANVNLPPVAEDDSFSLSEGTAVSGNVITHIDNNDGEMDSDADGDTLSVTQVEVNGITTSVAPQVPGQAPVSTVVAIAGGTLSISADGEFTYTNTAGFDYDLVNPVTPSFIYTLNDGTYDDTATVSITINDSAPVANDDSQSIELKGDILTGAASVTVSGNIIAGGTTGDVADTSADGTVTLVSVAGQFFINSVTPIVITTNFGQLSIDSSGAYIYTSQEGVALPDDVVTESFAYVIEDGDARQIESDTATLTINLTPKLVNPPVAEDDSFSLSEGTAVSGNVITHNDGDGVVDSDADGDILSVTQVVANGITTSVAAVGPTVVAIEGGSLSISADGEFTYTNTEGFDYDPLNPATQPSFIYTLTDGTYYDTATVLINIDDSAPVANGDNNGFVFREGIPGTVGGNVTGLGRMSSRDNADVFNGSNYASPTVTQVEYMGTTYKLDADNIATNPLQIDTQYGILSIDNIGGYTFDQKEDLIMVPDIEMNFTYTIQDGDVLKPETSSAVLSISISEPAPAPEIMTTQLSNDLDIDFNQTNGTIDTDFDVKALINVDEAIFVYGQNTDELSNILTDGHSGGLEIYLTVMAGDEGALVNIDPVAVLNNVHEEGFIVLENGETDSGHGAFSTITNGLLADGAIIVNDVAAELSAPIAELDSQDFS